MKKLLLFGLMLIAFVECNGQGHNYQWLIGDQWLQTIPKGRMTFDSSSYIYQTEYRKMAFNGTQGNICDAQGNFLMSSNGVWIANANNDTMLNGAGLNPGYFVNSYPNGLYIPNGNFFIPTPGDTSGFTLFHQTSLDPNSDRCGVYFSNVNINLDSGLGGVVSKNNLIIDDTLNWGINACKHANGRDWWVVCMKDSSDIIYKILITANGVESISTQSLGFVPVPVGNVSPLIFNKSGNQFAYNTYDNPVDRNSSVILCDFDRCNGVFSNTRIIPVSSGAYIWGASFSPNNQFLFVNTSMYVFQINTISLLIDTVATYDGFVSGLPPTCCGTTFMHEYLASNGKIYLTSGNGVQHLHEINYPDSTGFACDVQQHSINLGVWHFRSVPNHPNYNLGPVVGSVCDSITSVAEIKHNFKFSISPNPTSDGTIKLVYLLPQNKNGVFEVYNMTGQLVYKMNLPPWSTLQFVQLPELSNGVYTCVIKSGYERAAKKLVVLK